MTLSQLVIRPEVASEHRAVEELVRTAFWDLYQPGCVEHYLVHQLRTHRNFRPDLSFAAFKDGQLTGAIFYANATIRNEAAPPLSVLTFGPLAVLPGCQKQGIGKTLIEHTVALARAKGEHAIVIYGNPKYYRRQGFLPGLHFGITDANGDFCDALQVLELSSEVLKGHHGCFHEGDAYAITSEQAATFEASFPKRKKHALATQIFLGHGSIRPTTEEDFEEILEIVNDAASAYQGAIPADYWHDPYMPRKELRQQIQDGVVFYGYYVNGLPIGVMGIQDKGDVNLVRHAYVRTACQKLRIGGKLLQHLIATSTKPLLVGTWEKATWAVSFYQRHGFQLQTDTWRKNDLLRQYWSIPERQVDTSVVLVRKADRD